jgi:hypothetical protein
MILNQGEKVHIITRRLFNTDLRRHFVGEVQAVEDNVVRLEGYAFIFDESHSQFIKRTERRVRIMGIADSGIIINVIPPEVNLKELMYRMSNERRLVLTDGRSFSLDINEFSASH